MAVKKISIDTNAYELLAADKRPGESFSKVIKRRMKPKHTAAELGQCLDELLLENDTLEELEDITRKRQNSLADSPVFKTE